MNRDSSWPLGCSWSPSQIYTQHDNVVVVRPSPSIPHCLVPFRKKEKKKEKKKKAVMWHIMYKCKGPKQHGPHTSSSVHDTNYHKAGGKCEQALKGKAPSHQPIKTALTWGCKRFDLSCSPFVLSFYHNAMITGCSSQCWLISTWRQHLCRAVHWYSWPRTKTQFPYTYTLRLWVHYSRSLWKGTR